MIHLTTKQILQFTDGTLDYASQAQCTNHLAICERCRKEVDFQKALAKVSRRESLEQTSTGFVQRVMARVNPQRQKNWKTTLVDNLGNVFAMAMVLAIVGYALSTPSLFQMQEQSSEPSLVTQTISNAYTSVVHSFAQHTQEATQQVMQSTGSSKGTQMISLAVLSLLILVVLDQFVIKRFMGMKMKH